LNHRNKSGELLSGQAMLKHTASGLNIVNTSFFLEKGGDQMLETKKTPKGEQSTQSLGKISALGRAASFDLLGCK